MRKYTTSCQWRARYSRERSSSPVSVRVSPSWKAEATGKKIAIVAMTILEPMPKPNQSTSSGAMAKTGKA
jgi:hypothetical protein